MLSCNAVRDLLPSYLEHLTSPETDAEMEEHLCACRECQAIRDAMGEEVKIETAPKSKLAFFKKLRMKQIIGAVLSAVITLFCMYALYSGEFSVEVTDTAALEAAIDRYIFSEEVDANVLETRKVGDELIVLFAREGYDGEYGMAILEQGVFGKYRFLSARLANWHLYTYRSDTFDRKDYLLIYGVNDLPGVATYAIYPRNDTSAEPGYQGAVESAPFLRVVEVDNAEQYGGFPRIHYYDSDGNEIPEDELRTAPHPTLEGETRGVGTAETGVIYGFLFIVLVIGLVMIRYFLVP